MSEIKISENYWDVHAPNHRVVGTQKYEYMQFKPNNTDYSVATRTRFEITTKSPDVWMLPSKAFLRVRVVLQKDTAAGFADGTDDIALVNGGCIFSQMTLLINNRTVEQHNDNAQLVSLVRGLSEYSDDYGRMMQSQNFIIDNGGVGVGVAAANGGSNTGFTARLKRNITDAAVRSTTILLPLSHLFGATDIDRAFIGMKWTLRLVKNTTKNLVFCDAAALAKKPEVKIEDVSLWMPIIEPTLAIEKRLQSAMIAKTPIHHQFRSHQIYTSASSDKPVHNFRLPLLTERPIGIYVFFQKDARVDNAEENNMVFDHMGLNRLYCQYNSKRYPEEELAPSYAAGTEDHMRSWLSFTESTGRMFDQSSGNLVTYDNFSNAYPVYYIDLSNTVESVFSGNSQADIEVRSTMTESVAHKMHCVVVSEREVVFEGAGANQMIITRL